MSNTRKCILLCGYGKIGKVLENDIVQICSAANMCYKTYDPPLMRKNGMEEIEIEDRLNGFFETAFICVPTEKTDECSCDTSIVETLCEKLYKKCKTIIIKSTVPVGTTDSINARLGTNNIIFSPEFTSTTQHRGTQNFIVLGGDRNHCNKIADLYKKIKSADFEFVFTDSQTAEMSKYMLNCFLALKVTFCNEIATACTSKSIFYDDVRNIFIKDSRINSSHTFVYEDTPFYDSHCFNKDIPTFNNQFHLPLMLEVEEINNKRKLKK